MPRSSDASLDVASAISQGRRPYQEDALVTDFPLGAEIGFAVLADGMGGHAAGDLASKIVVTEVFSELKLQSGTADTFRDALPAILREAALAANACVKGHVTGHSETAGMGATLLAPVIAGAELYWISVGDSPLLLFRGGTLRQLNEDHSMAPQIDFMIQAGMMEEEVGRNHPDRNCLTSVLGGDEITRVDCPSEPFKLRNGDIVIAASDGIQYLAHAEIEDILRTHSDKSARWLTDRLLSRLEAHDDPEQDNATIILVKVALPQAEVSALPSPPDESDTGTLLLTKELAARPVSGFRSGLFQRGAAFFRGSPS